MLERVNYLWLAFAEGVASAASPSPTQSNPLRLMSMRCPEAAMLQSSASSASSRPTGVVGTAPIGGQLRTGCTAKPY